MTTPWGSDNRDDAGWSDALDDGSYLEHLEETFYPEPTAVDDWEEHDWPEEWDESEVAYEDIDTFTDPNFAPPSEAALAWSWQTFVFEALHEEFRLRNFDSQQVSDFLSARARGGQFPAGADRETVLAYAFKYYWYHYDEILQALSHGQLLRDDSERIAVVDIGCGPGNGLSAAATLLGDRAHAYVGFDHCAEMRQLALRIAGRHDNVVAQADLDLDVEVVGDLGRMVGHATKHANEADTCLVLISHLFKNDGFPNEQAPVLARAVRTIRGVYSGRLRVAVVDVIGRRPDAYPAFERELLTSVDGADRSEFELPLANQRFVRPSGRWDIKPRRWPKLVRILNL